MPDGWKRRPAVSEYVQFAGAMVLMVAILIGPYRFVPYAPGSPPEGTRHREGARVRGAIGPPGFRR